MLTATATDFTKNIHRVLMEKDADASFFQFEAKEELSEAGKLAQQHSLISKPNNKDAVIEEFRKVIKKEQQDKPVIIFTEEDEKKWFDELSSEYGKDQEVVWIRGETEANTYRQRDKGKQRGIYVLATKWCRGYDLKLAKDAIVLVLAYEKGFPWSKVNQMFGRGSRSFGISRGYYFTWKFPTEAVMKQQLLMNEKKYYDAHKLLAMLFESYSSFDLKNHQKALADGFGKPQSWHVTVPEFEEAHPSCFSLISKVRKEKSRKEEAVDIMAL